MSPAQVLSTRLPTRSVTPQALSTVIIATAVRHLANVVLSGRFPEYLLSMTTTC
jgi:hypothetical protein